MCIVDQTYSGSLAPILKRITTNILLILLGACIAVLHLMVVVDHPHTASIVTDIQSQEQWVNVDGVGLNYTGVVPFRHQSNMSIEQKIWN